jgi:hypothetical protein
VFFQDLDIRDEFFIGFQLKLYHKLAVDRALSPLLVFERAMDKQALCVQIIARLEADHALLLQAAKTAHAAATHEENIPDNKYATLGLEASYLAQGQANRAQEILVALKAFRQVTLQKFSDESPIRLTALVGLEDEAGASRLVFLGPAAGGLCLTFEEQEVMVITPASPLGRGLLGRRSGDLVTIKTDSVREYEIITVC